MLFFVIAGVLVMAAIAFIVLYSKALNEAWAVVAILCMGAAAIICLGAVVSFANVDYSLASSRVYITEQLYKAENGDVFSMSLSERYNLLERCMHFNESILWSRKHKGDPWLDWYRRDAVAEEQLLDIKKIEKLLGGYAASIDGIFDKYNDREDSY